MSYILLAVSIIWFIVRAAFGLPDGVPVFSWNVFLVGDILAAIAGLAGLYFLVNSPYDN